MHTDTQDTSRHTDMHTDTQILCIQAYTQTQIDMQTYTGICTYRETHRHMYTYT